jgi:hypothetical protein
MFVVLESKNQSKEIQPYKTDEEIVKILPKDKNINTDSLGECEMALYSFDTLVI